MNHDHASSYRKAFEQAQKLNDIELVKSVQTSVLRVISDATLTEEERHDFERLRIEIVAALRKYQDKPLQPNPRSTWTGS